MYENKKKYIEECQKSTGDCAVAGAINYGYRSPWKKLAAAYHSMCCIRAQTKGKLVGDQDTVTYLFLGLSAAAGKVTNEAKKFYRGDSDISHDKLENALASVRIYTEQLAIELRIDLDDICDKHMQEVLSRVDGKVA